MWVYADSLTLSSRKVGGKLQHQKVTKLSGDRWATFSRTEVLEEAIVHFLKPSPMELAERYHI